MALRVGIIGCGGIAALHARGYRAAADVEIVSCSDISKDRAEKFAAANEIPRTYSDHKAMLSAEKLDAVSVCTPNYAHCEPTCLALEAGVNVMCEKPIAMNSEEALLMVEVARKSKKLLTIGHHMRYLPFAQFLKKMIAAGDLGKIYFGRSHALRRRFIPGWGEFHIKSKSGGGPLIDIGVHALDLIVWLMGSPVPRAVSGSVYTEFGNRPDFYNPYGTYKREDYNVEDFACGFVKFANGASLTLEASWAAHLPEIEVHPQLILGNKGGAKITPYGDENPLRVFTSRDEALLDITPLPFANVEPHIEQLKHWVACLRGEKEILVRPEESLNIQRIIDSIYQSSNEGREIVIAAAA